MATMQYPLNLRFKLLGLAPRIIVTDANGTERLFVNQKILNLREDIRIYNNSKKEQEVFRIKADRIIDFSATYRFADSNTSAPLGAIKRKGIRSLWRATYYSDNAAGQTDHHIKEDDPWVKVLDAFFSEIPVLGLFGGYLFHPSYTAYRGMERTDESQPVMKLVKKSGFFEGLYGIELLNPSISQEEELQILLSLLLLVQLERRRG
jgi:hypothetical protein